MLSSAAGLVAAQRPSMVDSDVCQHLHHSNKLPVTPLEPSLDGIIDLLRLEALRYRINVQQRCSNNTSRSQRYYELLGVLNNTISTLL
jgi:hypothetical protein